MKNKNVKLKMLSLDDMIDMYPQEYNSSNDNNENELSIVNESLEIISFIELSVINSFLLSCLNNKNNDSGVNIITYGTVDHLARIQQGGRPDDTESFWFIGTMKGCDSLLTFQTRAHINHRSEFECFFSLTTKNKMNVEALDAISKEIKKIAFNNSKYVGKIIKVKFYDANFHGIEIIENEPDDNILILNDIQNKFIDHFANVVKRGGNLRYLLNGEPGTGKTKTIREIAKRLLPTSTFIIPEFDNGSDLSTIIDACNTFDKAVIIMDDIDLYIGSRDNGGFTKNLGEFLTIFDGVKKQKISFIASTNDKRLVDKAAERPGRFNFIIDYGFLTDEQIVIVCDQYLPEEYRIDDVYKLLTGKINGKKTKITGAFIYNLGENIRELANDNDDWSLEDTLSLIKESYKGFYHSQIENEKSGVGFING
jgi:hypothetical protein